MTELHRRPTTWLTNLRREGERLLVSGVTSNRSNVVEIASILPNNEIKKISHNKLRDTSVWNFEIASDLPKVDWAQIMESDMQTLLDIKEKMTPKILETPKTPVKDSKSKPEIPEKDPKPSKEVVSQKEKDKPEDTPKTTEAVPLSIKPAFPDALMLSILEEKMSQIEKNIVKDYWEFISAVKKGSTWHYRDLGIRFLRNYPESELVPYVRWRLAYRFYIDREYIFARQYVEPMLRDHNMFYPYAVLLAARIDYFSGGNRYHDYYSILRSDYRSHPLSAIFDADYQIIRGGKK